MDIEKFLESQKKTIDAYIKKYVPESIDNNFARWAFGEGRYSYDLESLNKAIFDPLWDFLNRGGKRWRPALFLLIVEALGGDKEKMRDFVLLPELTHNGCLTADTKILKNPGEQVRIDSIKPGDVVYTVNKEGMIESKKVLKVKITGEKEVYKLITAHREIKATKNHAFLIMLKDQPIRYKITNFGKNRLKNAMRRGDIKKVAHILGKGESLMQNALSARDPQLIEKDELERIFYMFGSKLTKKDYEEKQTKYERPCMELGWKTLRQLKKGDTIIVLRKIPDKGKPFKLPIPLKDPPKDKTKIPIETTENFCQIFGYILGDGCVTINNKGSRLYITPSNSQYERSAYKRIFKEVFDYDLRSETQGGYERLFCCSYKVCWLLRELGLEKSAITKKLPSWIFELPESHKCALVRGYLDSDGTAAKNGFVSFSSASEELIRGIKLLVDSIGLTSGIITKRKIKNLWESSKKKESIIWQKIGTERPDYKQRMLEAAKGKGFIFNEKYPTPPIDLAHLRFDTVKRIEKIGIQPVYDIMVEGSHNFIAENMVVHNSIMIDDIEDGGELRRGKPCTHKIWGVDVAINTGNIMYFLPLLAFMKNRERFDKEILVRAYEAYSEEMINIHLGQALDIWWHKGKKNDIKEEEYLQMCANKTGCLSRLAARLAVILSGGSKEQEEKFGKFAESLGIAFQIRDDILSATEANFADKKGYGDDIKEGKRSLIVIHTIKHANEKDRKRLVEILDMHTGDKKLINEAIDIIKKYKATEYAHNLAKKLIENSWKEIGPFIKESKSKESLKALADFAIERRI